MHNFNYTGTSSQKSETEETDTSVDTRIEKSSSPDTSHSQVTLPQYSERTHASKLLSAVALVASLGTSLVSGIELAQANSAAGTPPSGSVRPMPVIMQAAYNDLEADFSLDIIGVDPGSAINTFTDTAGTPCPTETVNLTPIASATITSDADGRAHASIHLDQCTSAAPGYKTFTAQGIVNGGTVTISPLTTYSLEGPRP